MIDLLFFLLLGHYIGDFALQSDSLAEKKKKSIGALSLHVLIYTFAIAIFLYVGLWHNQDPVLSSLINLYVLIGLYAVHWIQDFLKSRCVACSKQVYYIDQALHLIVLYLIRIAIYHV
jgi:uncharacterized membrane-anchored protein YitT (DUF2179 family)